MGTGRERCATREGYVWMKRGLFWQSRVWLSVNTEWIRVVESGEDGGKRVGGGRKELVEWRMSTMGCRLCAGWGREMVVRSTKRTFTFWVEGDGEEERRWKMALTAAILPRLQDFYNLGGFLGYGSTSVVRAGVDKATQEKVAIKLIRRNGDEFGRSAAGEREERSNFLREVQTLRAADNAHTVRLVDAFQTLEFRVIVTELCRGGSLLQRIIEDGSLSERVAKDVMRQLCRALVSLHSRGIVHRDVKLDNVMCLEAMGPIHVKLGDFGFAVKGEADPLEVKTDGFSKHVGTPMYMAWEMWTHEGYGMQVDSFALGVIMYALLSGRFPFPLDGAISVDPNSDFLDFSNTEWHSISDSAKSLIRALLHPNPTKRHSALSALQHRWFTGDRDNTREEPLSLDFSQLLHNKVRSLRGPSHCPIAARMVTN